MRIILALQLVEHRVTILAFLVRRRGAVARRSRGTVAKIRVAVRAVAVVSAAARRRARAAVVSVAAGRAAVSPRLVATARVSFEQSAPGVALVETTKPAAWALAFENHSIRLRVPQLLRNLLPRESQSADGEAVWPLWTWWHDVDCMPLDSRWDLPLGWGASVGRTSGPCLGRIWRSKM